jgi:hypothetical protein
MLLILQSNDASTFACCWLPIIVFAFIIIVAVVQSVNQSKAKKEKLDSLKPINQFPIGNYLVGLPTSISSNSPVECAVLDDAFVLIRADGVELGRIQRDSITQIIVEDKSHIGQRLTVTRILALGVFSLAAPKTQKHSSFYLAIDWDDNEGERQNTVFEFAGPTANTLANTASNVLKKYVKPKLERLKRTERKCPFCAEVIKREATLCRFCGSQLPALDETG